MKSLAYIVFGLLLLLPLGCGKSSESLQQNADKGFPPNTGIYYNSIDQVWTTLLRTVRFDYLFNIVVQNQREHFFVTDFVKEEQNNLSYKYRLTGTLKFEGKGVVVVLYREQQVLVDGKWIAQATDYSIEHAILEKFSERLRSLPQPTVPIKRK